ncbi:MAG: ankyrin repeat domain-containing protein [Bacillota bacterium]
MDANQRLADALRSNNLRGVRDALRKGADPNTRIDPQGHSSLYWAATAANIEMVQALLDAGAKPSAEKSEASSLHAAAAAGNPQILDLLLKAGGKRFLNKLDSFGYTPLMRAVESNNLDAARQLIEAGADVNAREDHTFGNTALRIATGDGSLDMVKLLINAGADPLIPGRLMLTPLDRARERHTPEGRLITAFITKTLEAPKPSRPKRRGPQR